MAFNYTPKICAMCGGQFVPAPLSIFHKKVNGRVVHFCSYKCRQRFIRERSKNNLTEKPTEWYNKKGGDDNGSNAKK